MPSGEHLDPVSLRSHLNTRLSLPRRHAALRRRRSFLRLRPGRFFNQAEVAQLSEALYAPDLESSANSRFDRVKTNDLKIYPSFRPEDADSLLESIRQLRAFYSDAAKNGAAIITCLV